LEWYEKEVPVIPPTWVIEELENQKPLEIYSPTKKTSYIANKHVFWENEGWTDEDLPIQYRRVLIQYVTEIVNDRIVTRRIERGQS
jgi:hypothetical protein